MNDKPTYIYKATVLERGWTAGMVREFLGAPDKLVTNPHYMSGPKAGLYDVARVEAVEMTAVFQDRLAKRRRTSQAAKAQEAAGQEQANIAAAHAYFAAKDTPADIQKA